MNIFDLAAKITLDSSGYKKGIDEAREKTSSFGKKLGSALGGAAKTAGKALLAVGTAATAATAAAGTAAVALGKQAVDAYANYEQLVGGVDTLFKDSSAAVQQYAAEAYKTAGMSANDYMETVTGFSASLIQSLDGDTAKAAEYANMAIIDMSDNANKMGSDISSIQNAYSGFAKQNYTMLDNLKLGYGGTKSEMERLLADAEAISGIHYDIENYGDVVQAIHTIQESMDIAGTTAKEGTATISGSIATLQGGIQNLVAGLGNANADIGSLVANVAEDFSNVFNNILPVVDRFAQSLPTATEAIVSSISAVLPELIGKISEMIPTILEAGMGILSALGEGIMQNLPMLAQAATDIILGLTQFIIEGLPGLIEAGLQIILTVAQGLAEALPELVPTIIDVVLKICEILTEPDTLLQLVDAALLIILALGDGLIQALPDLVQRVPEIIINLVEALLRAIPEVIDAGVQLVKSLIDGLTSIDFDEVGENLKQKMAEAWERIKEAWADIGEWFGEKFEAAKEAVHEAFSGIGEWFGERWSDIKGAFATAGEWFGDKFKAAKEAAQKHWEKIGDWFSKRKDEAQKAWNGFDTWMGNHFGEVWEAIKKPFKAVKKFFEDIIQTIKDVFSGNKSLLEVGQDIVDGIWNGIKGAAETFARNVKEFFGGIVNGVKDFLGIHSPSKLFKEQIGENIALGVAEGIDAKADKAVKAADDMAKDVYSRSKDWADKQTKYMELSLDDQIELWETIQGQFIETSKQYSDAEEKLYDLRKKKRDEEIKAAEQQTNEYVANIKSGLDKIKQLWSDYKTVYDKEYSSINGAFGLFASPKDREYVEGVDLMENMRKQIRDINQFYDGLEQLYERGVGRDMVDEIRAMGPGAINELVGLLDLSDQQLEEYYDMYRHKADVATYWTDRYTDNLKTIAEASITGMFDGMNVELNDALDAAYNWGEDYVKELAAGIEAGTLSYLNGSGAMIAGRLSGAENWSGDMHVTVNAAVGQTVEAVAQEVERRILNAFANRKQVYA